MIKLKCSVKCENESQQREFDKLVPTLEKLWNSNPSLKCDCGNDSIIVWSTNPHNLKQHFVTVEKYCCPKSSNKISNLANDIGKISPGNFN